MALPLRPDSHQLEAMSRRFLANALPRGWTDEDVRHDYGVDVRIGIFDDGRATNLELLVQLKATAEASGRDTEDVVLRVSTYNYVSGLLQVAILVKYIEEENEAYWIYFRDIPQPNQSRDTFTVHIPRTNRLSDIRWDEVRARVRSITDRKREAGDRPL